MASDDFSGVTVALDASSYASGQTMTLAVSGQNRHTGDETVTHETVMIDAVVQSSGGVTQAVSAQPVDVTRTVPGGLTLENVSIVSVTDSGGRSWTLQPGGLTATAAA